MVPVLNLEKQPFDELSAIKIHDREKYYRRERDIYRRLAEENVDSVLHCRVPRILGVDDELLVIEVSIVSPPFVIDFAGAYLDEGPDYFDEIIAQWEEDKRE